MMSAKPALMSVEGAKAVARRIMETYDRDNNGNIDNLEVVPMIVDAYKSFNRTFSPSRTDIDSYVKVLDKNGDGRVTIKDLEELCIRYLVS
jgi:Ca2+-binding EF-hand superfamily protein